MPGRAFSANSEYRYGFNGQEKSTEIDPGGNSMTAEFWEYDARLGRRWNLDPVVRPFESSYATFSNNPIWRLDPDGDSDTTSTAEVGAKLESIQKKDEQLKTVGNRIGEIKAGLDQMKSSFNQMATMEIGMCWNIFYWIPQLGNELVTGTNSLDYMGDRIAYWSGELNNQVNLFNRLNSEITSESASLKATLQGATHWQFGAAGILLTNLSTGHKNLKSAQGHWRIYEILVDGETFKFGIADATRLRKTGEFAGLPVRLAQQLSKIRRNAPFVHLNWEVNSLLKVSKAEGLKIEAKVIAEFAAKHGIPIGNVAEIAKWAERFVISSLGAKATKILRKFLKF